MFFSKVLMRVSLISDVKSLTWRTIFFWLEGPLLLKAVWEILLTV